MADEHDEEQTIAQDLVVTKYKMAAEIVNTILKTLVSKSVAGAKILDLCEEGDKLLSEETIKVFKKEKDMKKGIAFPTCVSVNNCICHFSPLKSDAEVLLQDGDLVKIDLGAHIDGFIAVAAHSFVVGASADNKVTGRKADAIMAAHTAAEAALRMVKPGHNNVEASGGINVVADDYHCKAIEGMLSHQLRRHVIDGEKVIIQNPSDDQKKNTDKVDFDVHEVYAIDILISTGEGKGREQEARTTVYKRKDVSYNLKMKTSRAFFSEVDKKYEFMPFTLRGFEDEKKAKMGVVECSKHDLVEPFTVLWDKAGEFVAQFKFTVLLMPNGPMKITGLPFDADHYDSEYQIVNEEMKEILSRSANPKAAKKKKKKATKQATDQASGDAPALEA